MQNGALAYLNTINVLSGLVHLLITENFYNNKLISNILNMGLDISRPNAY